MDRRYCFACDLKNDLALIAEYEQYHKEVWPEIIQSIKETGISDLQIYRIENRIFMIIEVTQDFSLEKKKAMDHTSPIVQKWETLMWKYQQALPSAKPGEKWVSCKKIFQL